MSAASPSESTSSEPLLERARSRRVLVAGIGNILLGDDGFGVAVANRLAREPLPDGTRVVDFGIRGVHLAFELLDPPPDLLILVDATAHGGPPGTLYLIDPSDVEDDDNDTCTESDDDEVDEEPLTCQAAAQAKPDAHGHAHAHAMTPEAVLAVVRAMNGTLPLAVRIVGCEPVSISEGRELSKVVEEAIEPAVAMIRRLIESE